MAKSSPDSAQRPAGVFWLIAYPFYAVFAAMVFLSAQEIALPALKPTPRPASADDPTWEARFPARVAVVEKGLVDSGLKLNLTREREQGAGNLRWTHRFYDLTIAQDERAEVEVKLAALQPLDAGVTLASENAFGGSQVLVGIDGLLTHTLRLYWAEQALQPRLSLIVAALGDDLRMAREVIDIEAPLELAIAPFRPFSSQVAELGQLFEREVFLQWPAAAPDNGLGKALASVPGAIGVLFPNPSEDHSEIVAEIEAKGLLQLSLGAALAEPTGGPIESFALSRGEPATVRANLIQQARRSGRAIAVLDVSPGISAEIQALLASWQEEKIELVALTQLRTPLVAAARGEQQ